MKRYIKSNKYPDFENYVAAKTFLNSVEPEKVALVDDCRNALLDLYAVPMDNYDIDNPLGPKESDIIRDFKSEAAEEWEDCDIDEADQLFDDILSALDVIHADDAAAWI